MNDQERMAITAARHAEYVGDPWKFLGNTGIPRSFAPNESELNPEPMPTATIHDKSLSRHDIDTQNLWDAHNQRKLSNATEFYTN